MAKTPGKTAPAAKAVEQQNVATHAAQTTAKGNAPKGAIPVPTLHDGFGIGLDTQAHRCGRILLAPGRYTLREVRQATGQTRYNVFAKLVQKGLAEEEPDGRMYVTDAAKARAGKAAGNASDEASQ